MKIKKCKECDQIPEIIEKIGGLVFDCGCKRLFFETKNETEAVKEWNERN